jgi:hypothetical protein
LGLITKAGAGAGPLLTRVQAFQNRTHVFLAGVERLQASAAAEAKAATGLLGAIAGSSEPASQTAARGGTKSLAASLADPEAGDGKEAPARKAGRTKEKATGSRKARLAKQAATKEPGATPALVMIKEQGSGPAVDSDATESDAENGRGLGDGKVYCVCQQPEDGAFMVQCDRWEREDKYYAY